MFEQKVLDELRQLAMWANEEGLTQEDFIAQVLQGFAFFAKEASFYFKEEKKE
jgi:hypothetical protein